MQQYLELCKRVVDHGKWVENKRTGKRCLTIINADLEYDVSEGVLPVLTTKKVFWKAAIAEMLGYLRGYTSAAEFRSIGCNTWNANANDNPDWLANSFRKGEDDMGRCYGAQGRDWRNPENERVDQLLNVYNDLRQGIDNRCEIMTFMNPGSVIEHVLTPVCILTPLVFWMDISILLHTNVQMIYRWGMDLIRYRLAGCLWLWRR